MSTPTYTPRLYLQLLHDAEYGLLDRRVEELEATHERTPAWRWLRRIHLESQIMVATLAKKVYHVGFRRGMA
jgi:hypothetical protein